jgi:hypothetical protein
MIPPDVVQEVLQFLFYRKKKVQNSDGQDPTGWRGEVLESHELRRSSLQCGQDYVVIIVVILIFFEAVNA